MINRTVWSSLRRSRCRATHRSRRRPEVNGFELPEQEIPEGNQKEPPKAAKPPKPKKEKPAKSPPPAVVEEVEDDEENEQPLPPLPVWLPDVLIILALVGFGGYKVSQFYAELDGQKPLGPDPDHHRARGLVRRRHCDPAQGTPVSSSMTGCSSSTSSTAARPVKFSTATLRFSPVWPTMISSRRCPS